MASASAAAGQVHFKRPQRGAQSGRAAEHYVRAPVDARPGVSVETRVHNVTSEPQHILLYSVSLRTGNLVECP